MKKLRKVLSYVICMLLLTCTFCHAQIQFNNDSIQEVIRVSFDSTKVKVGGAELLTIKMMVEYEKECYNDSTYVEYYQHNSPPMSDDGSCVLAVYIPPTLVKEWRHKEPTFKDFVRWAAKKYGL